MALQNARALTQGILILLFTAVALWASRPIGLALLAVVGVLKVQETFTGWCPSDLVFKPLGLKSGAAPKTPAASSS